MIEIEEMGKQEMQQVLERVGYGHLGCVRNERPYVVPINYAYQEPHFYIYTTEGQKTDFITANAEICLQVEEVSDTQNWRSVISNGKAEKLTEKDDLDKALSHILERNPALTPARNLMWIDPWGRSNAAAVYRMTPQMMSGRATVPESETRGPNALDHLNSKD